MLSYILYFFVIYSVAGLKTWMPNTNTDNPKNWDSFPVLDICQKLIFNVNNDISIFWNTQDIFTSEIFLPYLGTIFFPQETTITFSDKNKCSGRSTRRYVRNEFKNWLDPSNWRKSDSDSSWAPHIEQIPCAGEDIEFPSEKSFGIQLPTTLLPVGKIHFNQEIYDGREWARFLDSDSGHEFFKSSNDDLSNTLPWKNDFGCIHRKECFCGRSAYKITNGDYKDADYSLLEQAVCQNIKCETPQCLFPVIPDGHCCGICGAIIKLKDQTEDGLDLVAVRKKVNKEIDDLNNNYEKMTYIGRTSDGNIQIVFVAKNPTETKYIISFVDLIEKKLMGRNIQAAISLKYSGLPTSNYFFGGPLGVVIGTFLGVIAAFLGIYYFYIILPKKNFRLPALAQRKAFLFARFENIANDDEESEVNLEIAAEPETSNEPNKAFDNPMYTGESSKNAQADLISDLNVTSSTESSVAVTKKEFKNPVYDELEKSEINIFEDENEVKENVEINDDTINLFSEIEI